MRFSKEFVSKTRFLKNFEPFVILGYRQSLMKFFPAIIASLFIAAAFAVQVSAQTVAPGRKIGIIDTRVFLSNKNGIKKYVDAINAVNTEFKAAAAELDAMALRVQNLEKELRALREQVQKGVQVNETTVNAKIAEYEKLKLDYKFKIQDNDAKYNSRQVALVYPVQRDISLALQEFTKKNGFALLLDISKDRAGLFVSWNPVDVTREFIAFYNARPATPAAK
jgi:Skp family chaperone for outer membrane proteins